MVVGAFASATQETLVAHIDDAEQAWMIFSISTLFIRGLTGCATQCVQSLAAG